VQIVWTAIELIGSQERGLLSFQDCDIIPNYFVNAEPMTQNCREILGNNQFHTAGCRAQLRRLHGECDNLRVRPTR
jgi:hypothetical protein